MKLVSQSKFMQLMPWKLPVQGKIGTGLIPISYKAAFFAKAKEVEEGKQEQENEEEKM